MGTWALGLQSYLLRRYDWTLLAPTPVVRLEPYSFGHSLEREESLLGRSRQPGEQAGSMKGLEEVMISWRSTEESGD